MPSGKRHFIENIIPLFISGCGFRCHVVSLQNAFRAASLSGGRFLLLE
jgi:hypothetical protein